MTFSATSFKTLEALRTDLRARIGGMAGTSFDNPILNSFLQGAQEALFELVPWKHLRASAIMDVNDGSIWYDLPEDCHLERIEMVSIEDGGKWHELREGIELHHRNWSATPAVPCRYDIRWNADAVTDWKVQIELHPIPHVDSRLRVDYQRGLLPFTQDNHVASIPTGPLFLHALTNAKLHYRQPDGPAYSQQLEAMLGELKGRHRRRKVVSPARRGGMLEEDVPYSIPPTDYPA